MSAIARKYQQIQACPLLVITIFYRDISTEIRTFHSLISNINFLLIPSPYYEGHYVMK